MTASINAAHVGKRLLLKQWISQMNVFEARVLELSPSGNYVCLKRRNTTKTWYSITNWKVVEVLPETKEQA